MFFKNSHVFSLCHGDPTATQIRDALPQGAAYESHPWEITFDLLDNLATRTVDHNAFDLSLPALLLKGLQATRNERWAYT
jgi:hypothetical protein